MDLYCEHYVENDENFLLDDANVSLKCSQCLSKKNLIDNWNPNGTLVITDDHIETLEDSPLLINDCYLDINDDFHCHSVLIENDNLKAWKKLLLASAFCFLFMVTELIGGFLADSLAIMTDAAHLFSDFVGFLISLLSIWIARKPPTKMMTFGYYRAEVLGAFLSILSIWLLALIFATVAIHRLWHNEYEIKANTMILVATLGLIVNIIMGFVLFDGHTHSHDGMHTKETNLNVRAAVAHVIGDILQSIGVLIAAIIIKIFPNAKFVDPICTLIFTIVVIFTTVRVAKDSFWLLLEGSPINSNDLANDLKTISGIKHLHSLHIWSLSPGKEAIAVHLCVDKYCDRDLILKKATTLIKSKFNIVSCTIQVETYRSEIINSCNYCQLKC